MKYLLPLFLLLNSLSLFAEVWAPEGSYNKKIKNGQYLAKCVAPSKSNPSGKTTVYKRQEDQEQKLFVLPWYSSSLNIYVTDDENIYIVRENMWTYKGDIANIDDTCIQFYHNEQLLKSYSTLEIAGSHTNVSPSRGSYRVLADEGSRFVVNKKSFVYKCERVDGQVIEVDPQTGLILKPKKLIDFGKEKNNLKKLSQIESEELWMRYELKESGVSAKKIKKYMKDFREEHSIK